jgi:dTMP kinase
MGRFIALEGLDGAGKSTQAVLLKRALVDRGLAVVSTREPGGTALGEVVRALLLEGTEMDPLAEAYLFAAARAQLVRSVVRPALATGAWVVSDRFVDSSLAYQGVARGLGIDAVWRLNEVAVADCVPDAALVLDLPAEEATVRRQRGDDRIEAEGLDLQRAVAEGYRELAARFPDRVRLVDASGGMEATHRRLMEELQPLL